MKRLLLCIGVAALGACAPGIPPAPTTPMAAYGDSLVPPVVEPLPSQQIGAADAEVLEDLAVGSPDDVLVPAFDASGVRWDIDVRTYADHPRVQYYLRYFQGPARDRMAVFLERGSRFEPMIRAAVRGRRASGRSGVPGAHRERLLQRGGEPSRAVGMWQFMRGTGRGYGLRVDTWVDKRQDPVKVTDGRPPPARPAGAVRLALSRRRGLQRRGGRSPAAPGVAVGANRGASASRPRSALGRGWGADTLADEAADSAADALAEAADSADSAEELPGVTSDAAFFRLAESDLLAAETRDYVPKLIAAALIAKQPAHYGFTPAQSEPFGYDSLLVSDATGLMWRPGSPAPRRSRSGRSTRSTCAGHAPAESCRLSGCRWVRRGRNAAPTPPCRHRSGCTS